MVCRGCLECLLKLLNFLLTISGLAMIGYGIYLFVMWERASSNTSGIVLNSVDHGFSNVVQPVLLTASLSTSILDKLPKAWFIYLFIGAGVILFVISCFGCIGASSRNGCCLSCYSILLILLILIQAGCAAFIFFDHSWKEVIPTDQTGDFEMIYSFLKSHWKIVKWIALGVIILETLAFLLALVVRSLTRPANYDSDEEFIAPRSGIRQPLINRQIPPTGVTVPAIMDQRQSRTDSWSTRMREKYGLDTSEFTYNPTDPNRFQQQSTPPVEETRRCIIM